MAPCSPGKPATTPALLIHSGKHTGTAMSSRITPAITFNPMTIINFKIGLKLPRFTIIYSDLRQSSNCGPVCPDTTAEGPVLAEVPHLERSGIHTFAQVEFLPLLSVFIFLCSQCLAVMILLKFTPDSRLAAASNLQWSKATWVFVIGSCYSLAIKLTWLYPGKYSYC